ncbi:chromate efflux transporter [Azorhizobium doebereinerae]|uniref:chromate efflux transporter n=1 Tax=Azorhizobium doebereinerae TaxID=281091 RepID=UPI000417312C|nr:chromate transporter [Azorhizobium doebereinerae]
MTDAPVRAAAPPSPVPAPAPAVPSFAEAARVWARIGLLSFGGPAGQIALMHKELVEERRWIGEARFLHALNYCMLLPGPEAQQLATYVGWLLHRTPGGLVAGTLFVLPGAVVMTALSLLYAVFHAVPLVHAVFFGIKAAVLAVVVQALLRISRRALTRRAHGVLAGLAFLAIYVAQVPFPLVVLAAGLAGWLASGRDLFGAGAHASAGAAGAGVVDDLFARGEMAHAAPSAGRALRVLAVWLPAWLGPVAVLVLVTGPDSVWSQIGGFFSVMAVVTFGGAYAALAYVAQAAVDTFGWLAAPEMVDGLGLAETTPGPLILVLQFVGFLAAFRAPGALPPWLAGGLGGLLTLWVTFAPCFLWIFLGAPYMEALRGNRRLSSALSAITAAVVGVILNLALWFSIHVVFREVRELHVLGLSPDVPVLSSLDWRAAVLALAALVAMLRFKAGMLPTLAACAAAGAVLSYAPL